MGLGSVNENGNGVFLSIAGGFIWNRKADESDSNYATQEYTKANGETGVRKGARYESLTGKIVNAYFKVHSEYGESVNVVFEDSGENKYVISISTNNRYSQDMMKMLLKADLTKQVYVKPYDFLDKDKKRVTGMFFKQDGQKLDIRNDEAPVKDQDFFKNTPKKLIKRYFEDLSDWYVAEVSEKVCPLLGDENSSEKTDKKPEGEGKKVTHIKMKKAIKAYIAENYEGQEMPTLTKEEVESWYKLVLAEEELPFKEDEEPDSSVDQNDLNDQLDALLDK